MGIDLALNGLGGGESIYAALRAATGAFFALSGYHKLFNKERHAALVGTLEGLRIPFVGFNQWWVPGVEFVGGVALALGFLAPVAALMLMAICLVACSTDGPKRVASYHPIDLGDRIDDWLYLPEFIYALVLGMFVAGGAGIASIDALLR